FISLHDALPISCWCWASVRKSPVATRKAWSTMLVKRRSTLFVCLPRNTVPNEPAFFTHAARRSFFVVINSCWYLIKLFRALCTEILDCCYRLTHDDHLK